MGYGHRSDAAAIADIAHAYTASFGVNATVGVRTYYKEGSYDPRLLYRLWPAFRRAARPRSDGVPELRSARGPAAPLACRRVSPRRTGRAGAWTRDCLDRGARPSAARSRSGMSDRHERILRGVADALRARLREDRARERKDGMIDVGRRDELERSSTLADARLAAARSRRAR